MEMLYDAIGIYDLGYSEFTQQTHFCIERLLHVIKPKSNQSSRCFFFLSELTSGLDQFRLSI